MSNLSIFFILAMALLTAINATFYYINIKRQKRSFDALEAEREKVEAQKGKSYKEHMEYAFTDSNGKRYFYYPDIKKPPLPLFEKLNELQAQLQARTPGPDLDGWLKALETLLNSDSSKNTIRTEAGYLVGMMKERRTLLFEPTILLEITALLYIREDEDPSTYNVELHKEKVQQIIKDSKEGELLYGFFQHAGLSRYIPSQVITADNWSEYFQTMTLKVEEFNQQVMRTTALFSDAEEFMSSSEKT